MVETSRAIILKNEYPEKSRIMLLDQSRGVIACVSNRSDIALGTLIEYKVETQGLWYKAKEVEMVAAPCAETINDLLFVHRALEICVRSVFSGELSDDLFDLMCYLYNFDNFSRLHTNLLKNIFLCKIFIVVGIWPSGDQFQKPLFYRLATESIDNLLNQPIQLRSERDIEGWLCACVASHPYANDFKTWHFGQEKR